MTDPALELEDVDVAYTVHGIDRPVLRGVSFAVGPNEAYGLVGESGCGKSTVALAAIRYLPRNGKLTSGSIAVGGRNLSAMGRAELRRLYLSTVSMVYQNPGGALNPTIRIGDQLAEVFTVAGASKVDARRRTQAMLEKVRISDPSRVIRRYPHQLSGGMQQRVVIAMALAKDPALLILDEPTTGLDATVEAEILDLVATLRNEFRTSLLFISHNLAVISKVCDRVGVLYGGRLVEEGPSRTVFHHPRHPYTVGLLRCIPRGGVTKVERRLDTIPGSPPRLGAELPACVFAGRCALTEEVCRTEEPHLYAVGAGHSSRCHFHERAQSLPQTEAVAPTSVRAEEMSAPILRIEGLSKTFQQEGQQIPALADISLHVRHGETLGLVGESGSGKTTLARVLLGLTDPDAGSSLELDGTALTGRTRARNAEQVRALQMVFQNPDQSLNRRFTVKRILGRTLWKLLGLRAEARGRRVRELTDAVHFDKGLLSAKPAQLSGGLKQRVAIARAFAGEPRVVVCDEPTSALDVSVQATILNLFTDLQSTKDVTYIFISHDLGIVRYLADRIAVLYLGRLMEIGDAARVFAGPHHPYTEALLSAVPTLDGGQKQRIRLEGEVPSAAEPPSGCVFHTRCPRKLGDICEKEEPPLIEVERGHELRCHIPIEELRRLQSAAPGKISKEPDEESG